MQITKTTRHGIEMFALIRGRVIVGWFLSEAAARTAAMRRANR